MTSAVKFTRYGNQNKPKCILLCQHGSNGKEFFTRYLDFHKICKVDKNTFERYLTVERDFGSSELAHSIANKLIIEGCNAGVIEILLSRGVIDPNRIKEKCLANIFDKESNLELVKQLHKDYDDTIGDLMHFLDWIKPTLIVDTHSMSPYTPKVDAESPVRAVQLVKEKIDDYIQTWLDASKNGRRRFIDIVTQLNDGKVVADMNIANLIAGNFYSKGIPHSFNDPYPTTSEVMTTFYLKRYSGICIDVPKDYLADGNLDNLKINAQKVEEIGEAIANAILAYELWRFRRYV